MMNPLMLAFLTIVGMALITEAVMLVFFYLSTERFRRWTRSQRNPDPFLVEARVFFARLTGIATGVGPALSLIWSWAILEISQSISSL